MAVDPRITDPDARAYLDALGPAVPRAGLTAAEIRARPRVPLRLVPSPYAVTATDVVLPGGPDGAGGVGGPDGVGGVGGGEGVRARVYRPDDAEPLATMVYLHGGGWALGDLDINDDACRYLVDRAGVALVSVDYPLAPEHPFPAALEVATDVARLVASGAVPDLPTRLLLGGLSAGAALAAAVAARGVDGRAPRAEALALLSPVCDSDLTRPSYATFDDAPVLTGADMAWFWSMYDEFGAARDDPDAAPLRAASFAGLPPTSVVVAGVDPLRDEGVAYAEALRRDGVDVRLDLVPGVPHGFMAVPSVRSGRVALDRVAERVRAALA